MLAIKAAVFTESRGFILFSLTMVILEFGVFMCLRRQRIAAPAASRSLSPYTKMGGSGGAATRIDIDVGRGAQYQAIVETTGISDSKRSLLISSDRTVTVRELASADSKFIMVGAVEVHYHLSPGSCMEDQDGVHLLLMHGFGGSVQSWNQSTQALCALPFVKSVMAFDRPGFGLSSRPLPSGGRYEDNEGRSFPNPYTVEYSVDLLHKMMSLLNLPSKNTILVGHSTGGALALRACIEQPDAFTGCVCVSPTLYSEGFPNFIRSIFRTRVGKEMAKQLVQSELGEVRQPNHPLRCLSLAKTRATRSSISLSPFARKCR